MERQRRRRASVGGSEFFGKKKEDLSFAFERNERICV